MYPESEYAQEAIRTAGPGVSSRLQRQDEDLLKIWSSIGTFWSIGGE
jgi:hypothetical protein